MKFEYYKLFLIAFINIFFLANVTEGNLTGIEILDQQHHIKGSISGDYISGYDNDGPITEYVHIQYEYRSNRELSSEVSLGNVRASSNVGLISTSVSSDAFDIENFYSGTTAFAMADGIWIFQPLIEVLEVKFDYDENLYVESSYSEIWLTDVTEHAQLIHTDSYESNWFLTGSGVEMYQLSLNPEHQYSLRIKSQSGANNDSGWYSYINVSLTYVPSPGALLVCSFGLVLIRLCRKKLLYSSFGAK